MLSTHQKKIWISLAIIFLVSICFLCSRVTAPTTPPEDETAPLFSEEHVDTLEKFMALIKFADGTTLSQEEASGFYYDWVAAKNKSILYFSPQEFFNENGQNENILKEIAQEFLITKKLDNIKSESLSYKLQLRNELHELEPDKENTFPQKKKVLLTKLGSSKINKNELEVLSYLYALEGDYKKSIAMNRVNCTRNNENCTRDVEITINGNIKDDNGSPVEGVTVFVLNYADETPTKTNIAGDYSLKIKTNDVDKIRIRAIKQGYSDGFQDFYVVTNGANQVRERDFVITKAHGLAQINTNTKTAVGTKDSEWKILAKNLQTNVLEESIDTVDKTTEEDILEEAEEDINTVKKTTKKGVLEESIDTINKTTETSARYENGKFIIETDISSYIIPDGSIMTKEGLPYRGNATIYLYEFDKSSNIENMLRSDATDELKLFIGTILKTYGMPFIQFYSEENEELFVDKSNPLSLTSQIAEMEALMTGSDKIYEPLTITDMEKLVAESALQPNGYPINRQYLIDNNLLRFPAWWILDRNRGMWDSVPVDVLNT